MVEYLQPKLTSVAEGGTFRFEIPVRATSETFPQFKPQITHARECDLKLILACRFANLYFENSSL